MHYHLYVFKCGASGKLDLSVDGYYRVPAKRRNAGNVYKRELSDAPSPNIRNLHRTMKMIFRVASILSTRNNERRAISC